MDLFAMSGDNKLYAQKDEYSYIEFTFIELYFNMIML